MNADLKNWDDVLDLRAKLRGRVCAFRGVPRFGLTLKTSLERAAIDYWGRKWSEVPDIEAGLIKHFRRKAPQHLQYLPQESDFMAWAAAMQHYGAPTRLLDWTYSFFVALHFALRGAKPGERCAIWVLDLDWVSARARALLPEDAQELLKVDPNAKQPSTVRSLITRTKPVPLVYPLNPMHLNERLVVQQGVFLVPGDVGQPFAENVRSMDPSDDVMAEVPIVATPAFLESAQVELLQMNVGEATLFPGIDGFARGLCEIIPFQRLRATDLE